MEKARHEVLNSSTGVVTSSCQVILYKEVGRCGSVRSASDRLGWQPNLAHGKRQAYACCLDIVK